MAEFITTTSELLENIDRILKQEKVDRLRSIETIKMGVLTNIPIFPAIVTVPVVQQIREIGTEKVDIIRTIRFDVYTYKLDTEAAFNQCLGIINTLKLILRLSYSETQGYLPDLAGENKAFDLVIAEARFDDQIPFKNGFIQLGSFMIDVYSKGFYYDLSNTIEAYQINTQSKELMEVIKDTLKAYKGNILKKVAAFKSGVLTPSMVYPLLYVTCDLEEIKRKFTSADQAERLFKILIISKMLDKEEALLENLDISDEVIKILYSNSYFGGRVFNIDHPLIEYGQIDMDDVVMYGTSISFTTQSIETLT